jgi:NAD(P)-dependent dehydrogenase (short-subunit alcohol dehydrogenase family)
MTGRLERKICVVTGAAGGIGAAVVERFCAEGATVTASDIVDASFPAEALFKPADITDPAAVAALFEFVQERWGRLDVLVHTAAKLGGAGSFLDVTRNDWITYLEVNATGTFTVCQAAARLMVTSGTRGRIITLSSVNAFAAEPSAAPYVASKGAVRMLTKAMAVDLARYGITVNTIAPGPILVPRNAHIFARPDMIRTFERLVPRRSPGLPSDVAHAAVFLAEDTSTNITGTELIVDGGLLSQILPPMD